MTQPYKYNPALLYRFAEDFLALSFFARFAVGLEMRILDQSDAFDKEDEINLRVYKGAILTGRLPEFARHIYQAANGDPRVNYEPN